MQPHISCTGTHDRYAYAPIHINEEYGRTKSFLIYIAARIALALGRPKLLRYNGTAAPNSMIEKPGVLSIYRNGRRTIMRRTIKNVEGATPVTDCPD